jgi:hypothetical protein
MHQRVDFIELALREVRVFGADWIIGRISELMYEISVTWVARRTNSIINRSDLWFVGNIVIFF